jgi:hypothetical protein
MRRGVGWVVLVALAWPALGCGDDDAGQASSENRTVDRMVAAMERAYSTPNRGRLEMRVDTAADGRFEATGSYELHRLRARMRGRYAEGGETIQVELLMHARTAWMRVPQLDRVLPPGKRWIRTTDPEFIGGPTFTPDLFRQLLEAAGEVERLGRERVLGVTTEHLRATVDLRRLGETGDSEALLRSLGGEDVSLPVDVWIGPDGRPVRYHSEVRWPRPGGDREQYAVLDCVVLEYGGPVDLEPPPAAHVTDDSVLQ